jgi:hypothetical protein
MFFFAIICFIEELEIPSDLNSAKGNAYVSSKRFQMILLVSEKLLVNTNLFSPGLLLTYLSPYHLSRTGERKSLGVYVKDVVAAPKC